MLYPPNAVEKRLYGRDVNHVVIVRPQTAGIKRLGGAAGPLLPQGAQYHEDGTNVCRPKRALSESTPFNKLFFYS